VKTLLPAAALLVLAACSKEPPPSPDVAASKALVWDLVKAYHEAGDKGDVDAMKPLLAPEVSLVLGHEDVARGFDAVIRALTDRMKTYEGQARSTLTGKELVTITGDSALVTYVANVGTQRGLVTAVCRRNREGRWLLQHLHDTWSAPGPAKK
jgi:ketosteroid isomerase-like protein